MMGTLQNDVVSELFLPDRAGHKPVQTMQLHWAPERTMVVEQVVYFCQILLAHENCRLASTSLLENIYLV